MVMADVEELRQEFNLLVGMMCKALNDPKRLLILSLLGERPHTVSELVVELGSPQANVSQHLTVLRDRGLVTAERDGATVVYSLRHPRVLEAIGILRGVLRDELAGRQGLVVEEVGQPERARTA
jgi:DNA-binding transcriptional ArsR family regulator